MQWWLDNIFFENSNFHLQDVELRGQREEERGRPGKSWRAGKPASFKTAGKGYIEVCIEV